MKTINEVLDNYDEYKTFLEDRFGRRFCEFLTEEQMEMIGFKLGEGAEHTPLQWTFENIISQLKDDAEFGLEKANSERGISSSLMFDVCKSWCKIIDKEDLIVEYNNYGTETFENILEYIKELKGEKK